ncbi:MAG TPA: transaldolase family protein, partial [Gemmatimonadales bacterium]|nr:transaldolase family protein [Gemmatimonadales bacterium]
VTLLFSIQRYGEVIEAFLEGLERRLGQRMDVTSIASVASFFVSRVDGKIDPLLDSMAQPSAHLRGKLAIANAALAYQLFLRTLATERWKRLSSAGAKPQRPLWASTSTKDPAYPDVYYVEALVASETVNTVPPETLDAYRDHGEPALRIHEAIRNAPRHIADLKKTGIDLDAVTRELEDEGVSKFAASYRSLLTGIEGKIGALAAR